jgi:protein-S-isoprenylcysteine O-methyltransferase Ste14
MNLFLRNLVFTLVVPGSVAVYFPYLLGGGASPGPGLLVIAPILLFGIGVSIYLWSVSNFARRGRGTPLPLDPPKKLVIQGPYRFTRNPMYLAVFSVLLGWTLLYRTLPLLLYSLAATLAIYLFVTRYEEPHLRREFGEEYEKYLAEVPRWIPRRPR